MLAYAARDAEVTYALYLWLLEHYRHFIELYEEHPDEVPPEDLIAPWLLPFIQGDRTFLQEFIDEMGGSPDPDKLTQDCIVALERLRRPVWRARVLRTAADLALGGIIPIAVASLQALAAEERSAAARALGRLRASATRPALQEAADDPVFDVRRAAVAAIEQIDLPPRVGRFSRNDAPIADPPPTEEYEMPDTPWKAKLRGFLPNE